MPLLCLTIVTLAFGLLYVFLAERANNNFLCFEHHREIQTDPKYSEDILQNLMKNHDWVMKYEDRSIEICGFGLALAVVLILALAVLMLF